MAPQRYSVTPHPIVQRPFVWEATLGEDAFLVPVSPPWQRWRPSATGSPCALTSGRRSRPLKLRSAPASGRCCWRWPPGFTAFVRDPGNDLPALTTVLQRPWELTRKDLQEAEAGP
jgi:hypothetical protein